MITAYTPTFGEKALGLSPQDVLLVTIMVGFSNFLWLPIGGALSDRIGRTPILLVVPITVLVIAYPLMSWLVAAPTFGALATVLLTFSTCFGIYNGALIARLTEIMPPAMIRAATAIRLKRRLTVIGGCSNGSKFKSTGLRGLSCS